MQKAAHDLIILDEILVAVTFGLLTTKEVCVELKKKPGDMHLMLTGREAHADFLKMADLITEMKEVRHPYQIGIRSQIGMEY